MKRLLFILLVLTFSCAERELQLAVTTNNDITEILDVSPVYIFYDDETGDADLNRNNMISTTNWLVNIDKRLTLKQVLPHLQYLQDKRHGDSAHKNENAKNYFTCFNEETKNLSFIEFTDLIYELGYENITEPDFSLATYFGVAKFNSLDSIELKIISNGHSVIENYIDLDYLLNEINGLSKDGRLNLSLSYNSELTFQDYIEIKSKMLTINFKSLQIYNDEVIYN